MGLILWEIVKMNIAATFQILKVDNEGFELDRIENKVQFVMLYQYGAYTSDAITLEAKLSDCEISIEDKHGDWHEIGSCKVNEDTIATVIEVNGVCAVEGQPVQLTPEQLQALNEMIEEQVRDEA